MTGSAHFSYATGAIIFAGGLFAYIKKGSKPSLLASSIVASAFVAGGYLVASGQNFSGHNVSLATSLALGAFGLYRYTSTKKPFPAIPLILIAGVSAAYQANKALEWK